MSGYCKNKKFLAIFFLLIVSFQAVSSNIEVRSSVNLETIFTLISITSTGYIYQRGFDHQAKLEMLLNFSHFRVIQAAKTTERLLKRGFWLSSLALFSQCYSDLPEGKRKEPFPDLMLQEVESIIGDGKNPEEFLDNYFEQIRDFFNVSEFGRFFKEYDKYYKQNIEKVSNMIKSFDITEELKDYFNYEPRKYVVLLSALIPVNFNFGGSLGLNGQQQFLCFKGLDNNPGLVDGYTFTNEINLENVILHEFVHSFVKPVIRKNAGITVNYSYLFGYISKNMKRYFYSNWTSALEEHLVRAYEILYYKKTGKNLLAGDLLRSYESIGFRLIKYIHNSILECHKNKLPFSDNYTKILRTLDNVKPVKIRFLDRFGFSYRFNRGKIIITRVTSGSRFHQNGIQRGDVIYSINGKNVFDYIHLGEFFRNFNKEEDGEKVKFTILRGSELFDIEIEIPFRYEWYFAPS